MSLLSTALPERGSRRETGREGWRGQERGRDREKGGRHERKRRQRRGKIEGGEERGHRTGCTEPVCEEYLFKPDKRIKERSNRCPTASCHSIRGHVGPVSESPEL